MRRGSWLLAVQTALGLALLAVWLYLVDLGEVFQTLGKVRWGYVAAAALVGWSSTYIRAIRWRLILRPIAQVQRADVWLIVLASSLINFVIPIRSGELARSLFLKQRENVPISASLPTVAVDRSFDLLVVLLIGAVGVLGGAGLGGSLSLVLGLGAVLMVGFAIVVIAAIFWQERITGLLSRLVPRFLGPQLRERILGLISSVLGGFASFGRQPKNLVPLLAASVAATLIDASVFVLLFVGIGYSISPLAALTGYAFFALTFIVPGAPGYVGSFEAFGSLVFGGALGVPQAAAASVIVIYHGINAVVLGVTGGLAFLLLGVRPGKVLQLVAEPDQEPGVNTGVAR